MRVGRFGIFLLPLVQLMLCNGAFAETTVVTGVVGPGASYACFVPDNWNESVIYYAHGYRTKRKGVRPTHH